MKYIPAIGLEIHVELATKSKMFCSCPNNPDEERPNVNVCPICLGHPGTLPTINREAIAAVLRLGFTLKGAIAKTAHFDRKSYFYPDLPKGYQISQYAEPLVIGGTLKGIRVRRIHLEEDTGRLVHESGITNQESGNGHHSQFTIHNSSLVDFNRAGVPLMELVTEPDIRGGETAVSFARELQLILRYLGISRADMEKGEMRVEVNVSLIPTNAPRIPRIPEGEEDKYIRDMSESFVHIRDLGTKVEVKNLNSFRSVGDAIDYEVRRQERVLRGGNAVVQETRGWNDRKRVTESQRSKESAHDYRYFPEPDLPPLVLGDAFDLESLEQSIPELPEEKRERLKESFHLAEEQADFLVQNRKEAEFFEEAVSELKARIDPPPIGLLYNYLTSDLQGLMGKSRERFEEMKIQPEHFSHLIALVHQKKLSSRLAKDILKEMLETGSDPETLIRESGVRVLGDSKELESVARGVIEGNEKAAKDFQSGKEKALQFLIGQAMAATKGQADPDELRAVFQKLLHKE